MRIADAATLTPGRTGVGYHEHLLQHLAQEVESTGDELIVISNQPIDTARPSFRAMSAFISDHAFPLRIAWMQFLAARVLDDVRADVAHFTNGMLPLGAGSARVVTIHDMSLRLFEVPPGAAVDHQPPVARGGRARGRRSRHRLS